MPPLSKFRRDYDYFTGKVSEICRNLAFAGIAVIWMFKKSGTTMMIDREMVLPLLLFIAALTFDLLHYIWGSFIWGQFTRKEEKKIQDVAREDPELEAPDWYNRPSIAFFILKLLSVISAYIMLFTYLFKILI